jgi:hypothetical protein
MPEFRTNCNWHFNFIGNTQKNLKQSENLGGLSEETQKKDMGRVKPSEDSYSMSNHTSENSLKENTFEIVVDQRSNKEHVKHEKLSESHTYDERLVIESPVPDILLENISRRDKTEFSKMRYTAVTCSPDNFIRKNYSLRTQVSRRKTEILVLVTMYNEDESALTRSLYSIVKNIRYLCSKKHGRKHSQWGAKGWEKVVVCVVADGKKNICPRVLERLGLLGVYQDVSKTEVNGIPVQAHIYEYTSQICIDSESKFLGKENGIRIK